MNARDLKTRILPALLAGTRRNPLPKIGALAAGGSKAALHALSLAGQALRFELPAPPQQFAIEAWPGDNRPIVPDDLRTLLLRLLNGSKCAEDAERAVAWAFARRRLRPHPFDLPRIDGFVRRHAEHLGATAQHWAQREVAAEKQKSYFDADDIDEKNWTEAPPGNRARFLEEVRIRDAAGGRNLLASVWAAEAADVRLRLLGAMQAGLSQEDKAFLETAAKDRAPRVKSLAQRLLARLAGSTGGNPALAACLERIQQGKTGLFKKRPALRLELPATVKAHAANRWIREQFADVEMDEVVRALKLTATDLVEAAEQDENLLFALSLMASRERRFDLLDTIVSALPDAWGRMAEAGFDEVSFVDDAERTRWVETMVRPREWLPEAALPAWHWLLRLVEGPLPASVMEGVLASKWWREQIVDEKKKAGPEVVQLLCALCPRESRYRLREQIDALEPEPKDYGSLLLDILDRMETVA